MAPFIKVQGLARRPIRIGGKRVTSKNMVTLDLGKAQTRQELGHHVAIGQLLPLDFVVPAVSGTVVVTGGDVYTTAGTTARGLDVTAGTTRTSGGTAHDFTAGTVAFGAADATNPRVDLVQVHDTTGVVTVKAGTAAPNAAPPAADASNTALAHVYVPANATKPAWINDVRPRPGV